MKNVLYLDSGSGYGGSAKNLLVIIRNLDRTRFAPYVIVPAIGSHTEELIKLGVKLYKVPIPRLARHKFLSRIAQKNFFRCLFYYIDLLMYLLIYLPPLFFVIYRHRIDIIHGNNGVIDHFPVLFVSYLMRIPVIVHVSGTELQGKIERALSAFVTHFIVLNPQMKGYYDTLMRADKSSLIENGVDLKEVTQLAAGPTRQEIRQRLGILDSEIAVATLSRIVPGKGLEVLVKALKLVLDRNRKCKLVIMGDNPEGDGSFQLELKQLVQNLQLKEFVIFSGWQNNIYNFLTAIDIVAQVSTYPEGMSLAPMEAMAMEKPVIVSKNPGYERTIENRISGLQVSAGDAKALADAIDELIETPGFAKFLAQNGKHRVRSLLNAGQMTSKIERIYDTCT